MPYCDLFIRDRYTVSWIFLELIKQNISSIQCTDIYLTVLAAHALKAIRSRLLLFLFRYLRLTNTCTIILYSL